MVTKNLTLLNKNPEGYFSIVEIKEKVSSKCFLLACYCCTLCTTKCHLCCRWRCSLWRLIWRELILYTGAFMVISFVYR